MSIAGKVALVTGASRGIGKAIATELGQHGAIVIGTATTESGAEAISAYLAELGMKGGGYQLDVASKDSVEQLLSALAVDFEMPLILVNNAGITKDNLLLRMKEEE